MSQKMENMLNLSLQIPEDVRQRTEDLNVGYDAPSGTWELIVKYHGSLENLSMQGIGVEELIAGYAILTVPEQLVEAVAHAEQIEYVEKPKRFYYEQMAPGEDSCITAVTLREPFLTGEGVLIAVLDSGIDYTLPVFRKGDGRTRIKIIYDQTIPAVYTMEQINEALGKKDPQERRNLVPTIDTSGHGSAVAGIAAGYTLGRSMEDGREPGRDKVYGMPYRGIATEADLLIVKLGLPQEKGFPLTTQIMRGVTFAVRYALEQDQPLVINLSFGNNYGAHDGSSLLERFLDNASEIGRTLICVGSGNEGIGRRHTEGRISNDTVVPFSVGMYERNLSLQLWKDYSDSYLYYLKSPSGERVGLPSNINDGKYELQLDNTHILIYFGDPSPYSVSQELYFEFLPENGDYLAAGIWSLEILPRRIVTGRYDMYLSGVSVNETTGFLMPTPEHTLTIPSTAEKVLTVGAYDPVYDAYADFSGRGYGEVLDGPGTYIKPDLAAPGVALQAPNIFGSYDVVTGTSFATPVVSGSGALLMEWGIVRGKDPFLYGEKLKARLRKGARPLRGENRYPSDRVGYGALCVSDSFPFRGQL